MILSALAPHKDRRFGRQNRLLDANVFQGVFQQVVWRVGNAHFLLLAKSNNLPQARLGLVIPKKKLKLACRRQRAKRVIRESFRQQKHEIAGVDVVVLLRAKGLDVMDPALASGLDKLWQKLSKKCQDSPLKDAL